MFLENGFVGFFYEFVLEIGNLWPIATLLEAFENATLAWSKSMVV